MDISLIQVRNIQKPYTFEDDLLVYSTKSFFLKVTFIYRKTLLLLICFQRKCEQYWPDEGEKLYGSVLVKILDTEMTSDFIIRTFEISKVSAKSKERKCLAVSCMIFWQLLFHKRKPFCCHLLNFNVSTLFLPLISGW